MGVRNPKVKAFCPPPTHPRPIVASWALWGAVPAVASGWQQPPAFPGSGPEAVCPPGCRPQGQRLAPATQRTPTDGADGPPGHLLWHRLWVGPPMRAGSVQAAGWVGLPFKPQHPENCQACSTSLWHPHPSTGRHAHPAASPGEVASGEWVCIPGPGCTLPTALRPPGQ